MNAVMKSTRCFLNIGASAFVIYVLAVLLSLLPLNSNANPTIKKQPEQLRLITLGPHLVELIFDLGAGSQIVGTIEYSDFPSQASSLPVVGNYAQLNIEQIIALQPDIIIAWKTGNSDKDLAKLKRLGERLNFKVIYSDPQQLQDVSKDYRMLGKLLNIEPLAEQKALAFEQQLQTLQQRYSQSSAVTVFYEVWANPLTTIAGNAWPQQQLQICGASNPFVGLNQDYPQISQELVISADPQIIIQPNSEGQSQTNKFSWHKYPHLQAVKNQNILSPNADLLHRMSYRLMNELTLLCQQIEQVRMQLNKEH